MLRADAVYSACTVTIGRLSRPRREISIRINPGTTCVGRRSSGTQEGDLPNGYVIHLSCNLLGRPPSNGIATPVFV